eukprot:11191963-Lingulodinium_polyedra.AAC.1
MEAAARARWHRVAAAPEDVFAMYIAALLHDTVEDLQNVLESAAGDVRVLVIKVADRLHNMRTLERMPPKKQRRVADETRAVYVPLAERLGVRVWKTELEELCCRYLNGYAYELVVRPNEQARAARQRNLRFFQQYFGTLTVDWSIDSSVLEILVEGEPVHGQLRRWAARPVTTPPAPIPRAKVVTNGREMCWSCIGRIHALLPPIPGRLRDYLSSPKGEPLPQPAHGRAHGRRARGGLHQKPGDGLGRGVRRRRLLAPRRGAPAQRHGQGAQGGVAVDLAAGDE